jgi:hypothetical protein
MTRTRVAQKLLALFCAGAMVLNYPLLSLWSGDSVVFGLPLLPTALFGLWAMLIVAMAWLLERSGD